MSDEPRAQDPTHFVKNVLHTGTRRRLDQQHDAIAIGLRIEREKQAEKHDDEGVGQNAGRSPDGRLSMPEQLVMIGKPAGKIATAVRTKQLNPNGLKTLLQDINLGIHDAYQKARLLGDLSYSPDGGQHDHGCQDENDEG